jgi:hypothetical protein
LRVRHKRSSEATTFIGSALLRTVSKPCSVASRGRISWTIRRLRPEPTPNSQMSPPPSMRGEAAFRASSSMSRVPRYRFRRSVGMLRVCHRT